MDLAQAINIAFEAHRGQVDKSNVPYIWHCIRVMLRVRKSGADYMIVGVLHDVVEDTEWKLLPSKVLVSPDGLQYALDEKVYRALWAITKKPNEQNKLYIVRCRDSAIAAEVKKADIADNLTPTRMQNLDKATVDRLTKKYNACLEQLNAP